MTTWVMRRRADTLPVRENHAGELEWRVDMWLLTATVALMCISWVMVSSASIDYANQITGSPFYFSTRQGAYVVAACLFMGAVMLVPLSVWRRMDWRFMALALVLLTVVLIPGIGRKVNGSRRWIDLGIMTLQASEVAKWAVMVFLASYFARQRELSRYGWKIFAVPAAVVVLVGVLLMQEPDYGALVVITLAALTLVFLAGVPLMPLVVLLGLAVILGYIAFMSDEYRLNRLVAYLDPWDEDVVYKAGYQLTQSLIAIGRGEWFGVGLGNSVQKLFYLPEAHTDFVFSIWAEETGLVGSLVVLSLFALLVGRMVVIAQAALQRGEYFGAQAALGVAWIVAYQAFVNLGVATGLLPTKGLTLPLVSYGGSSLIVVAGMVAMVLRLSFENRAGFPATHDRVMPAEARHG